MKRTLYLALLAAMVSAGAAQATEKHVSIGAFGGFSIPVLQDVDASSFSPSDAFGPTGSQFGLRVLRGETRAPQQPAEVAADRERDDQERDADDAQDPPPPSATWQRRIGRLGGVLVGRDP